MPSNGGILYKVTNKIHNCWIKLLWKSQKKSFKQIGIGSSVLDLPFIQGAENIQIGVNFVCGKDVRIETWNKYMEQSFCPKIIIGNNVVFTDRCYLSCIDSIEIGDDVLLGRDVFITDNSHGDFSQIDSPPLKRPLTSKGSVKICNNVWIGRQTTVLSGVTIGQNSIIGANSLVNKDIPANCIAVGNPARVVKMKNPLN